MFCVFSLRKEAQAKKCVCRSGLITLKLNLLCCNVESQKSSMLTRVVFTIAFVASVAVAEPVKYHDCGSAVGKIVSVDVTPCPVEPCELIKGANTSISVRFTSEEVANSTKSVVHGILAGVPVPFPLSNPDGCKDSGLECPLKSSTTYTYTTILPVKPVYPQLKLVVKWELQDEKKNDIFCFEVPVQIVKKK